MTNAAVCLLIIDAWIIALGAAAYLTAWAFRCIADRVHCRRELRRAAMRRHPAGRATPPEPFDPGCDCPSCMPARKLAAEILLERDRMRRDFALWEADMEDAS